MRSQNGWPVLTFDETVEWVVPDTGRRLRAQRGPVGWILCHLALWFHEAVEPIDWGTLDDWGYSYRPIRGSTSTWSNHASGTAVDLNAVSHPLGVRNTFTGSQQRAIRERLAGRYENTIRWGGDYSGRADEMHFEFVGNLERAVALFDDLRNSPRGRRVRYANGRRPD